MRKRTQNKFVWTKGQPQKTKLSPRWLTITKIWYSFFIKAVKFKQFVDIWKGSNVCHLLLEQGNGVLGSRFRIFLANVDRFGPEQCFSENSAYFILLLLGSDKMNNLFKFDVGLVIQWVKLAVFFFFNLFFNEKVPICREFRFCDIDTIGSVKKFLAQHKICWNIQIFW